MGKTLRSKDFVKLCYDKSIKNYDFYFDHANTKEYCLYNRETKELYFIRETFFERLLRKIKRLFVRTTKKG